MREFGRDAPVRCWKTRTRGVLGFFAREAYRRRHLAAGGSHQGGEDPTAGQGAHGTGAKTPDDPRDPGHASSWRRQPERDSLSQLVEGTSDELTLGSAPVPAAVFSEVLAEAQAAVSGADARRDHPPWPAPLNALPARRRAPSGWMV